MYNGIVHTASTLLIVRPSASRSRVTAHAHGSALTLTHALTVKLTTDTRQRRTAPRGDARVHIHCTLKRTDTPPREYIHTGIHCNTDIPRSMSNMMSKFMSYSWSYACHVTVMVMLMSMYMSRHGQVHVHHVVPLCNGPIHMLEPLRCTHTRCCVGWPIHGARVYIYREPACMFSCAAHTRGGEQRSAARLTIPAPRPSQLVRLRLRSSC